MKKLIIALSVLASLVGAFFVWRNLPKIQMVIEDLLEEPEELVPSPDFGE